MGAPEGVLPHAKMETRYDLEKQVPGELERVVIDFHF